MEKDFFEQMIKESERILSGVAQQDIPKPPIADDPERLDTLKEVWSYIAQKELLKPTKDAVASKKDTASAVNQQYNLNARIKLLYDTYENWEKSDKILLKGELALIERTDDWGEKFVEIRCGNGKGTALNSLPVKVDYC